MKKILSLIVFLFFFILESCSSEMAVIKEGTQISGSFKKKIEVTVNTNYLIYFPIGYNKSKKKWPLMIFLHGSGERGNNLDLVKTHGPPKLVKNGKEFPFILVSPQTPQNLWWNADFLNALLEVITSKYKVDMNRIYLTGLSMGGYGTWDLAEKYPHWFAAIAPICGAGNPFLACNIKDIPTWVFHGAKDKVVPIEKSKEMVNAIKKCGGNPKFTIYPEAGHNSWTKTYNNPDLYKWFLSQSKN